MTAEPLGVKERPLTAEPLGVKERPLTAEPLGVKERPLTIKVIGIGGGGCNVVCRMADNPVRGVEYLMCDSDTRASEKCRDKARYLEMGRSVRVPWPTYEFNPESGRLRAECPWFKRELTHNVKGADLVLMVAGMGGPTASGAAPVIAGVVKQTGATVFAFVGTPFSFEGKRCSQDAQGGVRFLRTKVDNMVVIANDRILKSVDEKTTVSQAFAMVDELLGEGITDVARLMNVPGQIPVDPAAVIEVLLIPGEAIMATGEGQRAGSSAQEAVKEAIASAQLDMDIKRAKGVLMNFRGGPDISLEEYRAAAELVTETVNRKVKAILGISYPEKELGNIVKLTLIATGL